MLYFDDFYWQQTLLMPYGTLQSTCLSSLVNYMYRYSVLYRIIIRYTFSIKRQKDKKSLFSRTELAIISI